MPYYSAIGANVAAFKDAGVERFGYEMNEILEHVDEYKKTFPAYANQLDSLKKYQDLLYDVGELEMERQVADMALSIGCDLLVEATLVEGCRAAEFATNVVMVGVTTSKINQLVKNSRALRLTRDIAVMSATTSLDTLKLSGTHGNTYTESVSGMDRMLFSAPKISVASVKNDTAVVPFMSGDTCKNGEILDWDDFRTRCTDSTGAPSIITSIRFNDFAEPPPTMQSVLPMTVKSVDYADDGRNVVYGNLGFFSTKKFIEEFRFQIDDYQPDSIRWVKLDFNTRIQIIYERVDASTWYVYFEKNYKADSPVDTLTKSPIEKNGLFVFRPGEVLNAYKKLHPKASYVMSALMGDGSNVIYTTLQNKIGLSTSTRFAFQRQAADVIADEVWPKRFATLSDLDYAEVSFSNHAYSNFSLEKVLFKIARFGENGIDSTSLDSSFVPFKEKACASGEDAESCWSVAAKLDTILADTLKDGEYQITWDFIMDIAGENGTQEGHYYLNTFVRIDKTLPTLKLQVPNRAVTGTMSDGLWANVRDTVREEATRAMRGWLENTSTKKKTDLFYKANHNSEFYEIRWNGVDSPLAEGRYRLVVQAYDFAVPDSILEKSLKDVYVDSGWSSWAKVLSNGTDTVFVNGINGVTLGKDVWIDRTPAKVKDGSVKVGSIRDSSSFDCLDSADYVAGRGLMLNSCNLLSLSFSINENLLGRDTADVKVNVVMKDSSGPENVFTRDFYEVLTMDSSEKTFTFEEPAASRVKDGVYSVYVELRDEAGNTSVKKVVDRLVVDRTAPKVDVNAGGLFFTKIADLKSMTATVMQSGDDARLLSPVSCYRKLVTPQKSFDWALIRRDTASAVPGYDYAFSISDWAKGLPDGKWFVHVSCYDDAGNRGYGLDDFGIGARYPKITYPNDSLNSLYYGKVLVKGETPDPVVGGNDNTVSFKLEWMSDSDTAWHSDGFDYLAQYASPEERELAIWTIPDSASGTYTLRLSVKEGGSATWVSTDVEIPVYARADAAHEDSVAQIVLTTPVRQVPGTKDSVVVELLNSNDTTAWKLDARIYVRSQHDTSLVEAETYEIPRATVSPFEGKPSVIGTGLYIWQENRVWNVVWKGSAKGRVADSKSMERLSPVLSMKYVSSNVTFVAKTIDNYEVVNVPSIVVDSSGLIVPAIDMIRSVNLDSLEGDSLHLMFKTDDAFIIDISSLENVDSIAYCGANLRKAADVLPYYANVGAAYIHPEEYRNVLYWYGKTGTGLVPGGDTVFAKIFAYSRANPERMITLDTSWLVVRASKASVSYDTSSYAPANLYSPNVENAKTSFSYGVLGRGALYKAEVLDSAGKVVMTLANGSEFANAGTSLDARKVVWNGVLADGNMAPLGGYKFRVSVFDEMGVVVGQVESKIFHIVARENLVIVKDGGAELEMDEALPDDLDELRYTGDIDYLLRTKAKAQYLPPEYRTFNYRWTVDPKATQAPALYKKYRFSLGLRRHRSKFPVTVAVLLASQGKNFNDGCSGGSDDYPYKITVRRMILDHNDVVGDSIDISLMALSSVIGFDSTTSTLSHGSDSSYYPIILGVKVMPAGVFEGVRDNLKGKNGFESNADSLTFFLTGNAKDESARSGFSINDIWPDLPVEKIVDEYYKSGVNLGQWFSNFDQPVLWESGKVVFDDKVSSVPSVNYSLALREKGTSYTPCVVDSNDIDNKDLCGAKNAADAANLDLLKMSNSEIDMLALWIGHGFNTKFDYRDNYSFTSRGIRKKPLPFGCSEHKQAADEIRVRLYLVTKDSYWEPPWGQNNLANRYVRFDPTNTDLYGEGGYFKSVAENKLAYQKNFFGESGWTYSYDKEDALLTAFEAQRFTINTSGNCPLLFGDEIDAGKDFLYQSSFQMNFFGNPDTAFVAVAEGVLPDGTTILNKLEAKKEGMARYIGAGKINPLDISFTIAPVVSASDAMVQDVDNMAVKYPFNDEVDSLKIVNKTDELSLTDNYKFYKSERSRIHFGVNDWNDDHWDSLYVINSVIRNPITDATLKNATGLVVETAKSNGVNVVDTFYSYKVDSLNYSNAGLWYILADSLHGVSLSFSKYEKNRGFSAIDLKLVETDAFGNIVVDSNSWRIVQDSSSAKWCIDFAGVLVSSNYDYIYSNGPISHNGGDPSHFVPNDSVISQNVRGMNKTVSDTAWMKNVSLSLVGIYERDTNKVDSNLKSHLYLNAYADSSNGGFNITWNGKAPKERVGEIATFRGRVPGDSAFWRLTYSDENGVQQIIEEGIQDTFPDSGFLPILKHYDISKLQGRTTFSLMYGNLEGNMYRKDLVVRIGTRVDPDSEKTIWDKYAEANVHFAAGAWGEDPVDATLRTVAADEYIYEAFGDLDIVGPVVEILPSHKFDIEDTASWPIVNFKLSVADVGTWMVSELKIYKPNRETGKIEPLEMRDITCFVSDPFLNKGDSAVPCSGTTWNYVLLSAQTKSFSSFIVLDSNYANSLTPVDTLLGIDSLICAEMDTDTIWMGTHNGKLDFANPCKGRSNYLLQLRVSSAVAAEHQGTSAERLAWEARQNDIWLKSDIYTSRVDFFGVDGSTEQLRGPFVRVDSVAPTISDVQTSVSESGSDRILNVYANLADSGSGIASVTMNVYFGNDLVEMKELTFGESVMDTSISAYFKINGKQLRECVGCKASVSMVVNDHGYNHVEEKFSSEKLYPYPQSLVLWYPLSEGYGAVAHEMLGTGLDLSLKNMKSPWEYGGKLTVRGYKDYADTNKRLYVKKESPISFEFNGIVGIRGGTILKWMDYNVTDMLYIGVENGRFYLDVGLTRTSFTTNFATNRPVHFVFVFEGRIVSLYQDGSFVEQKTLAVNVSMKNRAGLILGSNDNTRDANFFRMSDLRIYSSALTAEQVRDLYHYEYVPDEETEKVIVVRAADVEDHDGLVIDQSCALPGKAYLRQKNSASEGWVNWMVDADAGDYALYLLMRGYTSETSLVEVSVNNVNYGIYRLRSSGLWESVRVGDSLKFSLADGTNFVSVRPVGGVGIAGLAAVSSPRDFDAVKLDFGQANWQDPEPCVEVRLTYDNYRDTTWARPRVQLRNLTAKSYSNAHFRYFYRGEGSSVQAKSFWPDLPMSVVPDAGDVFYADLALTEPIAPYGNVYGNDGLQLGLHRTPNYSRWNIFDDPSYAAGAENGYVVANGVALLDEDGVLLNEWQCYDDGKPAEQAKPSVRALAKDDADNPSQSSRVRVVVENNGSVAVDGFEVRYYYRDANGRMAKPDYYDFAFADTSYVNMGGGLYYVSLMYKNSVLNPGERNAYGNGAQFALHGRDWNPAYFDANDDPSHHGLSRDFAPADSIVVLDKNGNLLWGNAPQPKFADNFVVKPDGKSRVTRVGDVVYVEIDETGYYTLETVNAEGISLARLFEGTWKPGEYMVQIPADKLSADSFLVLRKGNVILNWQLLK